MATNLQIDQRLLSQAVRLGKHKTKRETVNEALAEYVQRRQQLGILKLFGTLEDDAFWEVPTVPNKGNGRAAREKRARA